MGLIFVFPPACHFPPQIEDAAHRKDHGAHTHNKDERDDLIELVVVVRPGEFKKPVNRIDAYNEYESREEK